MLGRHHRLLRDLRALRRDGALRRERGCFLAEGLHLAQEALDSRAAVRLAVVSEALDRTAEGRAVRQRLSEASIELHETADTVLRQLQDARAAQPVLLLVERPEVSLASALGAERGTPLVLVAWGVQDPGNLGALLRTAEAAGATGLIATGRGADLFHPRAVRASMGSIFRLPSLAASSEQVVEALRSHRLVTVACRPTAPRRHERCDLTRPVALLLGAEGPGLSAEALALAEEHVCIPMSPPVNSLSVGAAAAVLLFEARRQRASAEPGPVPIR